MKQSLSFILFAFIIGSLSGCHYTEVPSQLYGHQHAHKYLKAKNLDGLWERKDGEEVIASIRINTSPSLDYFVASYHQGDAIVFLKGLAEQDDNGEVYVSLQIVSKNIFIKNQIGYGKLKVKGDVLSLIPIKPEKLQKWERSLYGVRSAHHSVFDTENEITLHRTRTEFLQEDHSTRIYLETRCRANDFTTASILYKPLRINDWRATNVQSYDAHSTTKTNASTSNGVFYIYATREEYGITNIYYPPNGSGRTTDWFASFSNGLFKKDYQEVRLPKPRPAFWIQPLDCTSFK